MKIYRILKLSRGLFAAASGLALLAPTLPAAPFAYNDGDVILGFRQPGGPAPDSPAAKTMRRIRESSAYLGEHMGEVPVQVIACIEVDSPWPAGANQAGLWGSLLPAAWSYMLACRARGLGTAWTTLHLQYETQIAGLLGLPGDVRQGVLIPTAYYTGDTFRPAERRPLADVLHVDHW